VATLRERRPGVWEVRVFSGRDAAGKPTQVSQTFHGTKREVQRFAARLESGPRSTAAGRTVADVLNEWRDTNREVWAESTKRDYAGRAQAIADDPIGRISVARLGVGDVERWHTRMRRAGVGPVAIRSRHTALRAALAQAERWGWVTTNAARLATLRTGKAAPRQSMTPEEIRRVIDAARQLDPAAGLALRLAAVAGLRRAELAALQWSDFDVERGLLTVDSSITLIRVDERATEIVDSLTKTADIRTLRLDGQTIGEVRDLADTRAQVSPYLFSLTDGPPNPDRIGWWWRRARDASGIDAKWRLHDLRHWTATAAISTGHDVRTVAGRLGHANPAMTLRVYAHAIDAADVQLAESLGALLDESRPTTSSKSSST
jgi:integrase